MQTVTGNPVEVASRLRERYGDGLLCESLSGREVAFFAYRKPDWGASSQPPFHYRWKTPDGKERELVVHFCGDFRPRPDNGWMNHELLPPKPTKRR